MAAGIDSEVLFIEVVSEEVLVVGEYEVQQVSSGGEGREDGGEREAECIVSPYTKAMCSFCGSMSLEKRMRRYSPCFLVGILDETIAFTLFIWIFNIGAIKLNFFNERPPKMD